MTMVATRWNLNVEAREWQRRALEVWSRECKGILAVVTGAGKTVFAEMCMEHFMHQVPDGRVVIVVPTLALIDQWYVSLKEDLGVSDEDIATYSGEGRPREPRLVNLVVLNTARTVVPDISRRFSIFLIVDECHRAASPVNALALQGASAATLGLSATPDREWDSGLDDVLIPALGDVIFRYDYNAALRDGVISPFELVNVAIDLREDEQRSYDELSRRIAILVRRLRDGEAVGDSLKRVLRNRAAVSATAKMRIPAVLKLIERHPGARTIVFHERIAAAEEIKSLLVSRRINATIYHSQIPAVVRRDNLRLFRRGAFEVLVTCRALDEGTNVPETTVAVVASSTASIRQRVQRLGRVLRPAPGKHHAIVYTIYATDVEERRLTREALALAEAESITWQRVRLKERG